MTEIQDNDPRRMKLVDLYNQRREEKYNEPGDFKYENRFDVVHLCSKKMGFIKRLIEEGKIRYSNFKNLYETSGDYIQDIEIRDRIIMRLAISETPLEDLLSSLEM